MREARGFVLPTAEIANCIGTIALEEHFAAPGLLPKASELSFFNPDLLAEIEGVLPDLAAKRLEAMDQAGIEIAVLSQTAPGVQGLTSSHEAVDLARQANNHLQQAISLFPQRFRGFAAVPLQDIPQACDELRRCVLELGFVGVLVNGCTQGRFLEDPIYQPFWSLLEELAIPLYLHPGLPIEAPRSRLPELDGATWGWTVDTASHALRLVVSGLFERHPLASVILGHMGETLPYLLWRLDSRFGSTRYADKLQHPPSAIIKRHFYITTSGVCDDAPLRCAINAMGHERVMFATDYPYEDIVTAGRWLETAALSSEEQQAIAFSNAKRLLRISC